MKGGFRFIIPALFIWLSLGCEREFSFRGGVDGVAFSVDTVMFDTIFTSIGSTTSHFMVYNNSGEDMLISQIQLHGGQHSPFRINVSGRPGTNFLDVPLRANDSLFIFVEVTIDPTATGNPFLVADSIVFHTRHRVQTVNLIAYGQNIIVLRQANLGNQTLTSHKPYLIHDWVEVDSSSTLTIEAGARLHFHQGAFLKVYGRLKVNGTRDEPVLFAGSRLEKWYSDKPGQWGYIGLMPGSSGHVINNAVIRNGLIGIVADSLAWDGTPALQISNTRIEHKSRQGLLARSSSIIAYNTLFANCGDAVVKLTFGGHYEFYHCTIANFYRWGFRSSPALVISNYSIDNTGAITTNNLTKALFSNSIIHGSLGNEIELDLREATNGNGVINYRFDHSLLRTTLNQTILDDTTRFRGVIANKNPLFISQQDGNFQLDTLSVAKDAGDFIAASRFPIDYKGNSRIIDDGPDLGFIERVE